ncbi:MAG: hypothetical protein CMB81_04310 [Flammeovirgaceae bacterium]|nr:hypothetical protein [Flammeovirgaceae bacterium]
MDSRTLIVIIFFIFFSCDDLSCRFNKAPDPPYPNPDNIENFKNNITNQVTYIYECLYSDIYNKQFVAFTYTVQRDISKPGQSNINCWRESVYVTLGNC